MAQKEKKLKKSENGINVYSRKTENSAFKEIKSVVYIKTSLSSIVTLINDWENYPEWVYKCGKSVKLKELNDDYAVERAHALKDVFVTVLSENTFMDFMHLKGKEGGQHKFPRVLKGGMLDDWQQFLKGRNVGIELEKAK